MKILTVDIETKPLEAYAWGLWDQNIGINQIKVPPTLLCFAAKFHGERKTHFYSEWEHGRKGMAKALHRLFDEADAVVGWNSDKFDIRWIQTQFLEHGMAKPSPFAKVDLLKSVRRQVMLPSYKLDYVSQWLGIGKKVDTGGFELWRKVMQGCEKSRRQMQRYNIMDVKLTEQVLDRLSEKGWVMGLPNASVQGGMCCPNPMCGSENLICRGFNQSKTRRYQRYQCKACGQFCSDVKSQSGGAHLRPVA